MLHAGFAWVVACVLSASGATHSQSTPEQQLRSFFVSYAEGDAAGLRPYWTANADRAAIERATVLHHCQAPQVIVKPTGRPLEYEVLLDLNPAESFFCTVAEEDGQWRIARCRRVEDELAAGIVAASDDAARERILAGHPFAFTPALARAIYRESLAMTNRPEWRSAGAPARFGAAIAHDLGDLAAESLCLSILAIESRMADRRDEMVGIATDNLVMARESGDPDAIARALLNASRAWQTIDQKAPAFVAYNRELIALRDRIIDQTLVVRALADAAWDLAHDSFFSREWLLLLDDSLLLARAIGDTLGESAVEDSLAVGLANGTDCLAAMPHFERAEALERRVHGAYLSRILAVKSECLFELGLTAKAESEMLEAEAAANGD